MAKGILLAFVVFWMAPALAEELPHNPPISNQTQFDALIDEVRWSYAPIVAEHGAKLVKDTQWESLLAQATVRKNTTTWTLVVYGEVARVSGLSADAFTLILCHEMGHLLGGFPFYSGDGYFSSEGQADHFATHVCLRRLWKTEARKNSLYRPLAKGNILNQCNKAWKETADQNLCARIVLAAKNYSDAFAAWNHEAAYDLEHPDTEHVPETLFDNYPSPQCRLDTYFLGALCTVDFDQAVIPGLGLGQAGNGPDAELISKKHHCPESRPPCWYRGHKK